MVKSALSLSNTCAVNQSKDPFFLALPKAFDAELIALCALLKAL